MEKTEEKINGTEYSMTGKKANLYSILFVVPTILLALIPYRLIWGAEAFHAETSINLLGISFGLLPTLLIGVIVHELIHGVCFASYAKSGFKSIKFGIIWRALIPYCHCNEALKVSQYRICVLMPTIILGFIPVIASWITGNLFLQVFGVFLTLGGSGDFLIIWMMHRLDKNTKVKDHPSKIGFYTLEAE